MSHHTVDVATTLMGVHASCHAFFAGLYSDSPHAEFLRCAFDAFSKLDSDSVSEGGAVLRVSLHTMRKPRGDERDEHHVAADGIPWEAEEGRSLPGPEEGGAAGPDHHPPESDLSVLFHQATDEVPISHADPTAGEDCVALARGAVESRAQPVYGVVNDVVADRLTAHPLNQHGNAK